MRDHGCLFPFSSGHLQPCLKTLYLTISLNSFPTIPLISSPTGKHTTLAVEDAPPELIQLAQRAACLMCDGLYGVDIKQTVEGYQVIEVNDNPSIDAGVKDMQLGDARYRRIMAEFVRRLEQRGR